VGKNDTLVFCKYWSFSNIINVKKVSPQAIYGKQTKSYGAQSIAGLVITDNKDIQ